MTLTEYLREQAAALRARAEHAQRTVGVGAEYAALADHVEAMLTEHKPFDGCCECSPCWRPETHPKPERCVGTDCPTLRSVAHLVSVVSGTPIPEGAS